MEMLDNLDMKNLELAQPFLEGETKMETEECAKAILGMQSDLFPSIVEETEDNNDLNDPVVEDAMEILQAPSALNVQNAEYFPTDVQSCIEINSDNVISIPDDQIVKIQFENDSGIVNTQYIVNEEIIQLHLDNSSTTSNFIDLNGENIYGNEMIFNSSEVYEDSLKNTTDETFQISHREVEVTSEDIEENSQSTECLEEDLRQNQIQLSILSPKSEGEEVNTETDLTSLNWLHNITNIMSVPNLPTPPVSPKPNKKKQSSSQQEDLTININFYKKNGDKKPPFSYATLICMAMGKNGNKMTLSAIYHWIRENFLYYRKAHPSWQVKIFFHFRFRKLFAT